MTNGTVNLVVKVPVTLRRQARAAAVMRGETVSGVVREALAAYIARVEEEDDAGFVRAALARVKAGAPTFGHDEVWAELDALEAAGELPA